MKLGDGQRRSDVPARQRAPGRSRDAGSGRPQRRTADRGEQVSDVGLSRLHPAAQASGSVRGLAAQSGQHRARLRRRLAELSCRAAGAGRTARQAAGQARRTRARQDHRPDRRLRPRPQQRLRSARSVSAAQSGKWENRRNRQRARLFGVRRRPSRARTEHGRHPRLRRRRLHVRSGDVRNPRRRQPAACGQAGRRRDRARTTSTPSTRRRTTASCIRSCRARHSSSPATAAATTCISRRTIPNASAPPCVSCRATRSSARSSSTSATATFPARCRCRSCTWKMPKAAIPTSSSATRSTNTPMIQGMPGIEFQGVYNHISRGMHGSFSPIDVHNTLLAIRPGLPRELHRHAAERQRRRRADDREDSRPRPAAGRWSSAARSAEWARNVDAGLTPSHLEPSRRRSATVFDRSPIGPKPADRYTSACSQGTALRLNRIPISIGQGRAQLTMPECAEASSMAARQLARRGRQQQS